MDVITWRVAVDAAQCTLIVSEGLFLPHSNRYKVMHMKEGYAVRFCKNCHVGFLNMLRGLINHFETECVADRMTSGRQKESSRSF